MAADRRSEIVDGFSRQAEAFARSPLHRDAARLQRLADWTLRGTGERGLDVACGPGIVVGALQERGARMVGVDLTPRMLTEGQAATPAAGPGPLPPESPSFVCAEAGRLPFTDARFDFTVCRNAFHHLEDPSQALREMVRVTRRSGRVVVEDMRAPDDFLQRDYHEVIERLRDTTHVRTLTLGQAADLAAGAGLVRVEVQEFVLRIDFDEWIDRAYPSEGARARARRLMEDCLETPRGGLRVFKEGARLMFERQSLLLRAERP